VRTEARDFFVVRLEVANATLSFSRNFASGANSLPSQSPKSSALSEVTICIGSSCDKINKVLPRRALDVC
jgi:hypothetical protein